MADGTTKPVEQVKEGDLVLSKDEQTGIIAPKRVTGTSTRTVPVVETVNLSDDTGKIVESLTVTGDHPFYVEGQGFLAASQLPVGIKVEAKTGTLTVSSTERHETAQGFVVHNFTVEDDHSYFVGSASGGAWVHNGTYLCDLLTYEKHHIFPQAEEFRDFFQGAGVDVHRYTVRIPTPIHRALHAGPPNGGYWNYMWRSFKAANDGASAREIFAYGNWLKRWHGMGGIDFQPY